MDWRDSLPAALPSARRELLVFSPVNGHFQQKIAEKYLTDCDKDVKLLVANKAEAPWNHKWLRSHFVPAQPCGNNGHYRRPAPAVQPAAPSGGFALFDNYVRSDKHDEEKGNPYPGAAADRYAGTYRVRQ